MKVTHTGIFVRDQEEAVQWYSEKLGFRKAADMPMSETARWVTMSLPEQPGLEIVLEAPSMANNEAMATDMRARIGKSNALVFEVADVRQLVDELKAKGVKFVMDPTDFPWGTQAVFADLYDNQFVISQAPQGGYPTGLPE
ncbi:MAG: VOC family protein [bacterium]|nr:VOC family protein [bacterium]